MRRSPATPGSRLPHPLSILTLLFLLLAPTMTSASTGPTTPTFVMAWGGPPGNAPAQFHHPVGVATDRLGNLYVCDELNHRIQKFDRLGNFITQWGGVGSGDGQFIDPLGVATDATGNVFVADYSNHRIQKFSSSGTYLGQWGTLGSADGQFSFPFSLATDASGNLYVADLNNNRIQKFSGAGTFLTKWGTLGSGNGQFNRPIGVATDAAGNVYVADADNHRVQKFTGAGAYLAQWGTNGSGDGQFSTPTSVSTDAVGSVYVTDRDNHRVQKFSGAGTFLTKWGTNGSGAGQFNQPYGVAIDDAGNLYIADHFNHRVQKFSGAGVVPGDGAAAFVLKWGSSGSVDGQFVHPYGVATDASGNVYVVDTYNDRIQKFTSTGTYLTQWGSFGSGNGQFAYPAGVASDAAGSVYVVDTNNQRIQKFTSTGTSLTQWGSYGGANGQFNFPYGMATDAAGNVYVAEYNNHRIQKFANPAAIALVSDVRNDQGRQARLRILRSSADSPGSGATVVRYDVFRRIDALPSPALASSASTPGQIQLAGWDQVGTISAYGESEYNVVVPTLVDATAASLEYSAFMVRAATADPYTFFDSGAENGFSVDNLSPPAPTPFLAAYAAGATHLHWGVSIAGDFAMFRLYRGSTADFVPGPGTLVTATPDTGHVDAGPAGGYYKLSAVDFNGNESPFALVGPGQTTNVSDVAAPLAFALDGVHPNPAFGGRLLVHFALPDGGPATLELLDVAGRRVRERAVGVLGAGRHAVDLGGTLKPGLYFLRLTQGANQRVARATLMD